MKKLKPWALSPTKTVQSNFKIHFFWASVCIFFVTVAMMLPKTDANTDAAQKCIDNVSTHWNMVEDLKSKFNKEVNIIQEQMRLNNDSNRKKLGFTKEK